MSIVGAYGGVAKKKKMVEGETLLLSPDQLGDDGQYVNDGSAGGGTWEIAEVF